MTVRENAFEECKKQLEYRKIADLTPYGRNARTHSRKQITQIARSIERFGFTNPILIDQKNMILAGHGRVEAAKQLGWSEAPCLLIDTMTEAQKRAYVLADNRLAERAGWDDAILASELKYLLTDCPELEIDITGFSIAEIDEILDLGGTDPATEAEEDDQLEHAVDTGGPVCRPGDLWQLGGHRLICGNALQESTYADLMEAPAQMVFIDPPYNVPIKGHVTGKDRTQHREFPMASGEMSSGGFTSFLKTVFKHLLSHSTDGSIHFICMDWRHMNEVLSAGGETYSALKNLCIWVKDRGGMGSFYRSRHEMVFVFKAGDAPHINSFELGQHGRYRTNVWSYPGMSGSATEARAAREMHPTVKPVAMVADAIKDCSKPGGIVLDAFGGSGTTLIAAEKTRRRARVIELDPIYCDTAIRRWQAYAKEDAVLLETGERFEDVASTRKKAISDG